MSQGKKDRIIAGVLAFFGGSFGIHRFYLGDNFRGLMHILFSWTFIPSIISFFDAIGFLTMSDERFDLKYNPHLYSKAMPFTTMTSNQNVADEIHKLDQLFQRGVITFEEFEKRKARLLG